MPMAAYEMEVEFAYKDAPKYMNGVNVNMNKANYYVKGFLDYLTGRDGKGAELMVYDTYTKIGRQHVRFVSVSDDVFYRREGEMDVVTFSVTFKVNDPVTDITLSK
jgi:hypothetical protein